MTRNLEPSLGNATAPVQRDGGASLVHHFATDFCALESAFPGTYPRTIVRGDGAYLWDARGHRVLDAGVHLGACQVGHGRAEIASAVAAQLATLEFVGLEAGISHQPIARLAVRLKPRLPLDDARFWFCSSGSEANEIAFKVARAYHQANGEASRHKVISRHNSYHGATFAALSATGDAAFRQQFEPTLTGFVKVSHPSPGRCGFCEGGGCTLRCADELERAIIAEGPSTVAAFIAEPVSIFQAVKVPAESYWPRVAEICRRYGVLLIADEVVTGFGRTGRTFGIENWGVKPDIVTLAKGLTSGYVPMGAAAAERHIYELVESQPFVHLNTYAGHAGACAAALAALEILDAEDLVQNAATLQHALESAFADLAGRFPSIVRTTAIGLLGGVELPAPTRADGLANRLRHELYARGVAARVSVGRGIASVLFYPPLVVESDDVTGAVSTIGDGLHALRLV